MAGLAGEPEEAHEPTRLWSPSCGGTRAEAATAEEALRATAARVLSTPAVRRAVVSDLVKVLVVDPAADGLLQPM